MNARRVARSQERSTKAHGFTLWFHRAVRAGKSTLAAAVSAELRRRGISVEVLDRGRGAPEPLQGPWVLARGPRHQQSAASGTSRSCSRATASR